MEGSLRELEAEGATDLDAAFSMAFLRPKAAGRRRAGQKVGEGGKEAEGTRRPRRPEVRVGAEGQVGRATSDKNKLCVQTRHANRGLDIYKYWQA